MIKPLKNLPDLTADELIRRRVVIAQKRHDWGSGILLPAVEFQLIDTIIFRTEIIIYALQRVIVFLTQLFKINRFCRVLVVVNGRIESPVVENRLCCDITAQGRVSYTLKWIPGMLSNFRMYSQWIMLGLGEGRREYQFRMRYWRLLGRHNNPFLRHKQLPSAVVVLGCTKSELTVCNEARVMGIPLIGLLSSDCNYLDSIDYPLYGSDTSATSLFFILICSIAWWLGIE